MARQRFIHPDIWADPALGKLTPVERLLFIGCFSNADDEGRLLGNAAYLRSTIFPYDDMTIDQMTQMREHITQVCKNVVYYTVDDIEYLAFKKWRHYQKPQYPKPSKIPDPEAAEGTSNNHGTLHEASMNLNGTLHEASSPRLGLDRVGLGRVGLGRDDAPQTSTAVDDFEDMGRNPQYSEPDDDATEYERAALHVLKGVKNYPFDYPKDLQHLRSLSVDFPEINLLDEAKKWATYKLDKPLEKRSNPRSQFRTWCSRAKEYRDRNGERRASDQPYTDEEIAEATKRLRGGYIE